MSAKTLPDSRQQLIHLVRLGWELRKRGLSSAIDLRTGRQPTLLIPRTPAPLKVMALLRDGRWFFTWGRGRAQMVRALADDASERVWEAAQ
ncbi:hypothetical protein [Sphaerisporangium album]|uniref:hypothetical protein n=1 Tax=Sphaerisporangium album TaxID=509200 RepID=UPI0015F08A45|nr:hypothetical protein [Sphaerisporangium album]